MKYGAQNWLTSEVKRYALGNGGVEVVHLQRAANSTDERFCISLR